MLSHEKNIIYSLCNKCKLGRAAEKIGSYNRKGNGGGSVTNKLLLILMVVVVVIVEVVVFVVIVIFSLFCFISNLSSWNWLSSAKPLREELFFFLKYNVKTGKLMTECCCLTRENVQYICCCWQEKKKKKTIEFCIVFSSFKKKKNTQKKDDYCGCCCLFSEAENKKKGKNLSFKINEEVFKNVYRH